MSESGLSGKIIIIMKIKYSLLLAVVVALGGNAEAALTYDGFGYTVGTSLEASSEWSPLNTGTAPVISAGNLSVAGLATSTGNKVSFGSGNIQEALGSLDSHTVGKVYFSFAFSLTSAPTAAAYSFALATSNTNYGAVVFLRASGAGFNIGLANRSSGATVSYSSTVYNTNTTIFLVGSYEFISGTGNDVSKLWINPSAFGGAAEPSSSLTATGGSDLGAVSQFLLRGATGSPSGELDELRIGTTWQAVTVPEPGAALLGGLGMLAFFRRRR